MTLFIQKGIHVNKTEQKIRKIFEEADRDGDGVLKEKDLKHAFHLLGAHVPAWRAHRALRHADINHDGTISGEEEINNLIKYAISKYGDKVGY